MLVNPKINPNWGDSYRRVHDALIGYVTGGFNSGLAVVNKINEYPELREYDSSHPKFEGYCMSYGVADSIEQIQEIYKALLDDPNRKFYCQAVWVDKADEPPEDGWRWHKWGPYLGDLNPQHEYLYDEDDSIEGVWVFSFIEVLD